MNKITQFIVIFLFITGCFLAPQIAFAHQPRLIYSQSGDIQVVNPEVSQAFYDELKGQPRDYFIDSDKDFQLYLNVLVPYSANFTGRYSAKVFSPSGEQVALLDASSVEWKEYYESFGRDFYLKGPELTKQLFGGKYKIEVYSTDNKGKYILAVGQTESFDAMSVINIYWQIPLLKIEFFKTSVWQFFLTPFGIAGIGIIGAFLILLALINYLIGAVKRAIKHNRAKTLLLTSGGMPQMKDELVKLLQKPAYDVTVAFVNTAYKYELENDPLYRNADLMILRDELGFNVEEIDIEGKKESEVFDLLQFKDIIFVAGGNTFYLLKAMRNCKFEKVIKKLLKWGKVYIGVSAGSIVAGKTIKTAGWGDGDKNFVHLNNLKGLNLVPFDICVHYQSEDAEIIKQQMPDAKKRAKKLKILTDDQAILVQGREVDLIGDGEAVVV